MAEAIDFRIRRYIRQSVCQTGSLKPSKAQKFAEFSCDDVIIVSLPTKG